MDTNEIRKAIEFLRTCLIKQIVPDKDCNCLKLNGLSREAIFDLFISKTINYSLIPDSDVADWIAVRKQKPGLVSGLIPVEKIEQWHINKKTGNISHESGRFFSITGLKVRHSIGYIDMHWDQPIIDQPEVGILGILVSKINGVLHFCLHAKEEPGNINLVQLAPTVQATYSNYTKVHGGHKPPFIDLFLSPSIEKIFFSKLQTEDGGRFFLKSNKNMIVWADDGVETALPDGFIWLTLRQIRGLIKQDNLVNSCTRSVLSCLI